MCFIVLYSVIGNLSPSAELQLKQYIGPNGTVSVNAFFGISLTVFSVIGFLLRNVLAWIVGIGILTLIAVGIMS